MMTTRGEGEAVKPKRKARGIVLWVACWGDPSWYYPFDSKRKAVFCAENGSIEPPRWKAAHAICAGSPRLKPGEVKKVRVVIEEVTPKRGKG